MGERKASMFSGRYQSIRTSVSTGSKAFFRDLISWGDKSGHNISKLTLDFYSFYSYKLYVYTVSLI